MQKRKIKNIILNTVTILAMATSVVSVLALNAKDWKTVALLFVSLGWIALYLKANEGR